MKNDMKNHMKTDLKIDLETEFFSGLIELGYGQDVEDQLKKIAEKIDWAKGWPENNKSFWNAEAFMWNYKIDKIKRKLITEELAFLQEGRGKNLDLGCGAYSYIPSVGFDISEKMLLFNDNCKEKIIGSLEEDLPFKDNLFDSVTAVFVLNYVKNHQQLLLEIRRVLKEKGIFVAVLYSGTINNWQNQKVVNNYVFSEWRCILQKTGFSVESYEKEKFWFFRCKNKS
ncbi:MAG: methyltransferase domain-containing protein [Nanoarchaeota archaeon]|nr:methyltransferase domain-containing protein [Nanoarchaeota archaeon]